MSGGGVPDRPLAVAHRAGNEPELLRAAEDAAVDLVELDLWRWRGRLEVRHLKTLGPVPLLWDRHPWRLVAGWRPRTRLEELIGRLGSVTELMLDLKGRDIGLARQARETVAELLPGRRYTVCSQSWSLLEPFRGLPGVRVVHSVGNERMLRALPGRLAGDDSPAVSIDQRLLTAGRVDRLRELAPLVMAWTINSAERLRTLTSWGVNGVISDDLGLLRRVVSGETVAERPR